MWFARVSILVMILTGLGCGSPALDYEPRHDISSYPSSGEAEGFVVAIDVPSRAETERQFGIDLRKDGIVAAALMVQNSLSDSSYLLLVEKISLQDCRRVGSETGGKIDQSAPEFEGTQAVVNTGIAVMTAGAVVLSPGVMLAGLPILVASAPAKAKADAIKQGMLTRALRNRTITPGQRAHGFVYFRIGDAAVIDEPASCIVRLEVQRLSTREDVTVELPMRWGGR